MSTNDEPGSELAQLAARVESLSTALTAVQKQISNLPNLATLRILVDKFEKKEVSLEKMEFNRPDAAHYTGLSISTLEKDYSKGRLEFYKKGGQVFFSRSELDAYLKRRRKGSPPDEQIVLMKSVHPHPARAIVFCAKKGAVHFGIFQRSDNQGYRSWTN